MRGRAYPRPAPEPRNISVGELRALRRQLGDDIRRDLGSVLKLASQARECLPIDHPVKAHLYTVEAAYRDAIECIIEPVRRMSEKLPQAIQESKCK